MQRSLRYAFRLTLALLVSTAQLPSFAQSSPEAPLTDRQLATEAERADGRLTLGGRFGESASEGYLDYLQPLAAGQNALLFLNPKLSGDDNDESEWSIGLGGRIRLPEADMIVGANVFYDERTTRNDNRFDQIGAGVEALSKWVDARANYYWPDDKHELIDSSTATTVDRSSSSWWTDIYAQQNQLKQNYVTRTTTRTTTRTFERFEAALEGWDAEIGARLPFLPDRLETRVFAGYYHFEGDFTEDIKGAKGRLEVRALPALVLDAEVFENTDLTGSDYFLGARLDLPFDLANLARGKNPFEGIGESVRPTRREMRDRLSDMVMRDPHVRIHESEWIENEALRTVDTKTSTKSKSFVVLDDVNFVNNANNTGIENGTAENPWNTVQEGVNAAYGQMNVYVFQGVAPYQENIYIGSDGVNLLGEGKAIPGYGGKTFGGDKPPFLDGNVNGVNGPVITVAANNVLIQGFYIGRSPGGTSPGNTDPLGFGITTDELGILGLNANNLFVFSNTIENQETSVWLLGNSASPYSATILENTIIGMDTTFGSGVSATLENTGPISLTLADNAISGSYRGFDLFTLNADSVSIDLIGNTIAGVGGEGIYLIAASIAGDVNLLLAGNTVRADLNNVNGFINNVGGDVNFTAVQNSLNDSGGFGVYMQTHNISGDVNLLFAANQASGNAASGASFSGSSINGDVSVSVIDSQLNDNGSWGLSLFFTSVNGSLNVLVDPTAANNNGASGIQISSEVNSNITITLDQVTANNNAGAGININAISQTGSVHVLLRDVVANGNGANGVAAEAYAFHDVVFGNILPGGAAVGNRVTAHNNVGSGIILIGVSATGLVLAINESLNAHNNGNRGVDVFLRNNGAALFFADQINANNNRAAGAIVDIDSDSESSIFALRRGMFSNNDGPGLYLLVESGNSQLVSIGQPDFPLFFDPSTIPGAPGALVATNNLGPGIIFAGVSSAGSRFVADEIVTSYNDGPGIFLSQIAQQNALTILGASVSFALTSATPSRVNADFNAGPGIIATVQSANEGAELSLVAGTANNNLGGGVVATAFGANNASVFIGSAFSIPGSGSEFFANNNSGDGINATVIGNTGNALFGHYGGGASENGGAGLFANVISENSANAFVGDVFSLGSGNVAPPRYNANVGPGLFVNAYSVSESAGLFTTGFEANNNTGGGVIANLTGNQDAVAILGYTFAGAGFASELVQANHNTGNGLLFSLNSAAGTARFSPLLVQADDNTVNGLTAILAGAGVEIGLGFFIPPTPVSGSFGVTARSNAFNGVVLNGISTSGSVFMAAGEMDVSNNGVGLGLNLTLSSQDDLFAYLGVARDGTNFVPATVRANNNQTGMFIDLTAENDLRFALVGFEGNNNSSEGVRFDVFAGGDIYGELGKITSEAGPIFGGGSASGNGAVGLVMGLESSSGNITLEVNNVAANLNQGDGAFIFMAASNGLASLTANGLTANSNLQAGAIAFVTGRTSTIALNELSASGNQGGRGVSARAHSGNTNSISLVTGNNMTLNDNFNDGGLFRALGGTNATVSIGSNVEANNNGRHGIVLMADGDAGGSAVGSANANNNVRYGVVAVAVGPVAATAGAANSGSGNGDGGTFTSSDTVGPSDALLP